MKRFLLILSILLIFPALGIAETVCLKWSPNSESDLAGYRAFVRQAKGVYDYSSPAWEGEEITCCLENLDLKKLNFFVVRAYDTEGFESEDSNEVYQTNGPPVSPGSLRIIPQGN